VENISYSLANWGKTYNPYDWFYNPSYLVARIYYILGGTAYYKDKKQLKPGFLYIFRAAPDFKVSQSETDPVDHIYFDFVTHTNFIQPEFIEIDPGKDPKLLNLLLAIKEDFTNPLHPENIAKSYLDILIHYLKPYLDPMTLLTDSYSEITKTMLNLIYNRPLGEITVNRLAAEMNNNVNHIIRCFKKDVGITPHQYISIMKRDLAIAYMRSGMSKTEIAAKLGYNSLSAFSYFLHNNEDF